MNRTLTSVAAVTIFVAVALVSPAMATQVYQTSADFISETFADRKPVAKAVWVTGDLKRRVTKVLGHDYRDIRVRYWTLGNRSAWILEEIGKVEPITLGVVVEDGHIEQVKVLTYRESRGFEIRFPFFMDQFRGARVDANNNNKLDRSIDGISGATLSVRATTKLARIALLLERHAENGVKRARAETQAKTP